MTAGLIGVFGLIAAAGLFVSVQLTVGCYRNLPRQVPDHFDMYGWPDSFGPRPAIFILVAAQALALAVWVAVVAHVANEPRPLSVIAPAGAVIDAVVVGFACMQRGIVAVSLGKAERLAPWRPAIVIAAGMLVSFILRWILR